MRSSNVGLGHGTSGSPQETLESLEYEAKVEEIENKLKKELGENNSSAKDISQKISSHSKDRQSERGVSQADIENAIEKPIKTKPVKYDSLGRPSQQIVGENATVVINPQTGAIVTVWRTGKRNRRK